MGCIHSQQTYILSSSGNEKDYQQRFLESKTLGQGEFGVVKLVHDVKTKDLVESKPLAVKYLKKGYTFRDNTLYTPMKKEVLQGEVEILRRLNGECFNLKLVAVYETPSTILMVTEYCEGGEMIPYVTKAFNSAGGLRTEDVSRISFQLWSAVDHCARHRVIHRDIKPENIMFCTTKKDSELRLIDFGSGTLDGSEGSSENPQDGTDDVERHHTFAGSAFYISPEMFQRTYTSKTDVWSAAATLYVLVAGYPADQLQKTFNILQSNKAKRLKNLPNMPDNMPDSFYDMLEGALAFRHKSRLDAGQLMKGEFAQFHIHHAEQDNKNGTISIHEVASEAAGGSADTLSDLRSGSLSKTKSVLLEGSVTRHNAYLGYQKFERSVTTLLATMLTKEGCKKLVLTLREHHQTEDGMEGVELKETDVVCNNNVKTNASKLQVIKIMDLLSVLESLNIDESAEVIGMIRALDGFALYESFAYHISLLRQFVTIYSRGKGGNDLDGSTHSDVSRRSVGRISSVHGGNVWNTFKSKRPLEYSGHGQSSRGEADTSTKSTGAMRTGGMRRVNTATGALSGL